jgi:transposase-like protein
MVEDYPRTLAEFERRFSSEEACRAYMRALRWPEGFRCGSCGGPRGWPIKRGELVECGTCHHQTSATAGTIFEGTRAPLMTWFRAMWYVTSQKSGVSALGLQRVLGLGSYQTAWSWLHKLRRAMVRPGRDRLVGKVEVDETYVGGTEAGVVGRQTEKKALVAIAAEADGRKIGRIRMARVPDVSARSLTAFVQASVTEGAAVRTDGWSGYTGLGQLGYKHRAKNIAASGDPAHVSMPAVHRVAALLKRWLLGTHQGAVRISHLDYYLDEFTFRFNRRTSRSRGKLFYRLLQQAVAVPPAPYRELVGGRAKPNPLG